MIYLEIEPYCDDCHDFSPDVVKPERSHTPDGSVAWTSTTVRCEYRNRCRAIRRYLEQKMKVKEESE